MEFNDIKNNDLKYICNTYGRFNLALVKGKGSLLYDNEGKSYIDFGSGIAVNSFGVADTTWEEAVIKQVKTLSHCSNLYYSLPQIELAKMLMEKTGMAKVFFGNSGAEANEGAIKCARKYSSDKYSKDRNEIITLRNSFHGRTIATLAATGQDVFHKNFGPFPEGFKYGIANDLDSITNLINDKTCAIMIETIQGEGGILNLTNEFVKGIEELAIKNDLLLIVDEVQTGNGRTGYLYSYMYYGIKPNIVTTAKGLAGGLPLGAVMFDEKCSQVLSKGDHGSTFGGNPIACSGACSILSRIDDKLLASVIEKEKLIRDFFKDCPNVIEITGRGLMLGIKTPKVAGEVAAACIKEGLLVLTAKDKIRLLPALNIPTELLIKGLEILKKEIIK